MTIHNSTHWFCLLLLIAVLGWASFSPAQDAPVSSKLEFESSDPALQQAFRWAKAQALAYAHPESESIGAWYEAALPGRDSFCMRDVSHQTTGAAALGLYSANHNMLKRFAASLAPERDWAGYWEIDRLGRPSAADYISDSDFWYNLPANFDLLDAVVRMWRWTGDDSYWKDLEFERFFQATANSYISTWQLQPGRVLSRPRIMNRRLQNGEFVNSRGIPSYTEGRKDFNVGSDLLAAEYRALQSLQQIAVERHQPDDAKRLQVTADAVEQLIEQRAWSGREGHFHGFFSEDGSSFGSGDAMLLYFNAVRRPEHLRGALDFIASPEYWQPVNIEEESYLPLALYRYGRSADAYRILLDLSNPDKKRREYPEVSYAVIAAIVSGMMGLEPSEEIGNDTIQTLSQLHDGPDFAELRGVAIKHNIVDLRHVGTSSSTLTNRSGPPLQWKASFPGIAASLKVNGKWMRAQHFSSLAGMTISWVTITVPPGSTSVVVRDVIGKQ
ncbi:glucosidase family protein [Acidicapsa acidisoli]|uniref:hypothetical protein n=1 Tax=Acidicapsa acidisoli TaxID=1615681 RepID=UPI0021E0D516|nr:hypothetical protein [Acidicapsa acidisoli]